MASTSLGEFVRAHGALVVEVGPNTHRYSGIAILSIQNKGLLTRQLCFPGRSARHCRGVIVCYPFLKTTWLVVDLMFRPLTLDDLSAMGRSRRIGQELLLFDI